MVLKQMGVFRTNCLDCLDRTNVVQTEITRYAIVSFLNQQGERLDDGVETVFNNLWADNGDWLSRIYTGTGALKSSYTRKGKITISGFLDDAAKSVNRFYMNNFQDKSRQEAIDLLVGRNSAGGELLLKNPLHDQVQSKLKTREAEFCSRHTVNLFVGSFNVNGKIPSSESLDNWLKTSAFESPDMYIIGIQELIQLVAEQVKK